MKYTIEEKILLTVIKNQDRALNAYHRREKEKVCSMYWNSANDHYNHYLTIKKKPIHKRIWFKIKRLVSSLVSRKQKVKTK